MNLRFYKYILTSLLFAAVRIAASAQTYEVRLNLSDKKTGEAVSFATVSLSREGSDKVLKYAQTDEKGNALLQGVREGTYLIKGIMLGYEDYSEVIKVNENLNLGSKKMKVQVNYLEGAVVSDVGNAIQIKKDTIEHNVSIMKQTDSDVLEDLLKRLPGVEIGDDGSITANGKTISKVYIDGKAFFLDDPKLATKNLPAKIVNKVKIIDKKSEQAEFTGIEDGDEETVLDLNIKPGMMNGWMGNVTGGAGMDLHSSQEKEMGASDKVRFQGGGLAARFTESDQLVFLGNVNNTNNRGFNDITGNSMGGMRRGGMRGGNNGISTSYMLGVNGSKIFDDKSEINGNYLFNGNEKAVEETSDKTTFKEDGSELLSKEKSLNLSNTYGHRAGGRFDWKISPKTSILFLPNFNYGWGNFCDTTGYETLLRNGGDVKDVNRGESKSVGNTDNISTDGRLLWRQRIGSAKGRTISVNLNYSVKRDKLDGINQSETEVFDEGISNDGKNVDQSYNLLSKSWRLGGRAAYTEPLGNNFFAEASYSYNYTRSSSDKVAYNKGASGKYDQYDTDYSSTVGNEYISQNVGLSIKKQTKKFNATIGANYMPSHTISRARYAEVDTTIDRTVYNWSPNARVEVNFDDNNVLRFNYRGRTTQPSTTQLLPVPDNSDPQRLYLGNPGLTPSFSHNVNADYRYNNKETFFSLNARGNMVYSTNNIVNASYYGDDGVQYTIPINNSKGALQTSLFAMINAPIAQSGFSIMSFTRLGYNKGVNLVGKDNIDPEDPDTYLDINNYSENLYRSASVMERLRFLYRNDILEASIGGRVRYSQSWYSIASQNVAPAWTNSVDARLIANIPDILSISTNCEYTFYAGYSADFNKPMCIWNAELSRQIFKKKATVAFKMYDILNQSRSVTRNATDNYVLDKMNNTLGRYFVVTLTWRFGNFGSKKDQIQQSIMPRNGYGRGRF